MSKRCNLRVAEMIKNHLRHRTFTLYSGLPRHFRHVTEIKAEFQNDFLKVFFKDYWTDTSPEFQENIWHDLFQQFNTFFVVFLYKYHLRHILCDGTDSDGTDSPNSNHSLPWPAVILAAIEWGIYGVGRIYLLSLFTKYPKSIKFCKFYTVRKWHWIKVRTFIFF